MIVAAIPIDPPDGDKCWAFYVINDASEPVESIVVEEVGYEWGDAGSKETLGKRFGPIAADGWIEVHRETATEVRTALTLSVRRKSGVTRIMAEVGRLYATPRGLESIPILARAGKRASIEAAPAPSDDATETSVVTDRPPPLAERLELDDTGVRLSMPDGTHAALAWRDLHEVRLSTTKDALWWTMCTTHGEYSISSALAQSTHLYERVRALPGFDAGNDELYNEFLQQADFEGSIPIWRRRG